MNDPLPGVSGPYLDVASAASEENRIDCANLVPDDLVPSDLVPGDPAARDSVEHASATLWDRCCHASLRNRGIVATYAADGEDGQVWIAPESADDALVLGYAPVEPDFISDLCIGGGTETTAFEPLIGFAPANRSGGDGQSFSTISGGSGGSVPVLGIGAPGIGVSVVGLGAADVPGGGSVPAARSPGGFISGVVAPSAQGGGPARVPEIDAVSGIVALAVLSALVAFRCERR